MECIMKNLIVVFLVGAVADLEQHERGNYEKKQIGSNCIRRESSTGNTSVALCCECGPCRNVGHGRHVIRK
jgi:hypothetical protein